MEQELIFKLVAILGGSAIGGITIADVIRIIAKLVVKAKSLKAIRYNKEDKAECVAMLKESQAKEIKIDMAKELDKATNNRVAEVEKAQNEIIASLNCAVNVINAMGNCISELKSISPSANANRVIYKTTARTSTQYMWFRSPFRSYSCYAWYLNTFGIIYGDGGASVSVAVAPVFVI